MRRPTKTHRSCPLGVTSGDSCRLVAGALDEELVTEAGVAANFTALAQHVTMPLMKSLIAKILVTLAVLYALAVASLAWAMHQPPDLFGRVMSHVPGPAMLVLPFETIWMRARAGTLHKGDQAPDFALRAYDKSSTVQLSSFRGNKPVVLVFGSYT